MKYLKFRLFHIFLFQIKALENCDFKIYNNIDYEDAGAIPLDAMNDKSVDIKNLKWKLHMFVLGESLQTFNYRLSSPINPMTRTRDFDNIFGTKLCNSELETKGINEIVIEISYGMIETVFF